MMMLLLQPAVMAESFALLLVAYGTWRGLRAIEQVA